MKLNKKTSPKISLWEILRRAGIKKILKISIIVFLFLILVIFYFFFVGKAPQQDNIKWGVNFSQKHSQQLGLDWRENYLALLDDLGVKNIKISTHWDIIEQEQEKYSFDDLDWQIDTAEKYQAKIFLVIGLKTLRWPECHIPEWAKNISKEEREEEVLELIEKIVSRYKDKDIIWAWQVENEPFFPFGECPETDENLLKKEIELVKSINPEKPVIITDTGELSLWFKVAELGDIVGITTYKKVYSPEFKSYIPLPYPAFFYWRRAQIIERFFNKQVLGVELQTEPWCPSLLYDCSIEEQKKTMDLKQFKKNVDFAKRMGLNEFYLWGSEWWYWLKVKQNDSEIWNEAKKLFD
ncbi:MAG: endo-1,4-beta-xylanase [Candidatus Nealsonbacteria bacterium]